MIRFAQITAAAAAMTIAGAAGVASSAVAESATCERLDSYVETFRRAMVGADEFALARLADDQLSFGHSNGVVQSKREFIESITSGSEIFNSIELEGRTHVCDGEVSVERHEFVADILLNGEPLFVRLSVVEVWRYEGHNWKLVARQAFKT